MHFESYVIDCPLGNIIAARFGYGNMFYSCSLMGTIGLAILVFLVKPPQSQENSHIT